MRNPKAVASACRLLGGNVRQLRVALGLTQTTAAQRAGIYWRHWQKIEYGTVNVTLSTLVGIAYALETTIVALFAERRAAS